MERGARTRTPLGLLHTEIAGRVSLDQLDEQFVAAARRMATIYAAIAAFESMVRDLVRRSLLEEKGANWWEECVSANVRNRATKRQEDEARHRFHTQRGDDPISFIDFGDLLNIIRANEGVFEAAIPSPEWARGVFDAVERSRNVIMHSGTLDPEDIERVGMNIRDWVRQVGA
jgi:Swt1-like HEPN